jgi:hypothetical protein
MTYQKIQVVKESRRTIRRDGDFTAIGVDIGAGGKEGIAAVFGNETGGPDWIDGGGYGGFRSRGGLLLRRHTDNGGFETSHHLLPHDAYVMYNSGTSRPNCPPNIR